MSPKWGFGLATLPEGAVYFHWKELTGINYMGQAGFKILQFPSGFQQNSAQSCENLGLPKAVISRKGEKRLQFWPRLSLLITRELPLEACWA